MSSVVRPPYDPELISVLEELELTPPLGDDTLSLIREANALGVSVIEEQLARSGVVHTEQRIAGPGGEVELSVLHPPGERRTGLAVVYSVHGGGMVAGDRFTLIDEFGLVDWVTTFGIVVISPEYRLAPEHPGPAGVEDCYAGLQWIAAHADELGIDPSRIILAGASGGGGIAAGTALLARDRGGPALLGQLLVCPQLDDRSNTTSAAQFSIANGGGGVWPTENNQYAWNAILGTGHEDVDVDAYSAAGRRDDLAGLPPTYLDVGSAEVFRDETVAYASRLWAAGVSAELHVWPGGFHGFDVFAPTAKVSQVSRDTRCNWVRRILGD